MPVCVDGPPPHGTSPGDRPDALTELPMGNSAGDCCEATKSGGIYASAPNGVQLSPQCSTGVLFLFFTLNSQVNAK